MSEEIKLLPCPACNDEASILENVIDNPWGGDITVYSVQCTRCGLLTGKYGYKRQALEDWNAIPRALRWSKETPKKQGWYFTRRDIPSKPLRVMYVKQEKRFDHRVKEFRHVMTMADTKSEDGYIIEDLDQQDRIWAGPIPEPKEVKHD